MDRIFHTTVPVALLLSDPLTVQGTGICDLICSIVCGYGHLLPRVLKHREAKAAVSCRYLVTTVWLKNIHSLLLVNFVNYNS